MSKVNLPSCAHARAHERCRRVFASLESRGMGIIVLSIQSFKSPVSTTSYSDELRLSESPSSSGCRILGSTVGVTLVGFCALLGTATAAFLTTSRLQPLQASHSSLLLSTFQRLLSLAGRHASLFSGRIVRSTICEVPVAPRCNSCPSTSLLSLCRASCCLRLSVFGRRRGWCSQLLDAASDPGKGS